jgi:hypothetical protein
MEVEIHAFLTSTPGKCPGTQNRSRPGPLTVLCVSGNTKFDIKNKEQLNKRISVCLIYLCTSLHIVFLMRVAACIFVYDYNYLHLNALMMTS